MCGGHSHHKHGRSLRANNDQHSHDCDMHGVWHGKSISPVWKIIAGVGLIAGILVLFKLLT